MDKTPEFKSQALNSKFPVRSINTSSITQIDETNTIKSNVENRRGSFDDREISKFQSRLAHIDTSARSKNSIQDTNFQQALTKLIRCDDDASKGESLRVKIPNFNQKPETNSETLKIPPSLQSLKGLSRTPQLLKSPVDGANSKSYDMQQILRKIKMAG